LVRGLLLFVNSWFRHQGLTHQLLLASRIRPIRGLGRHRGVPPRGTRPQQLHLHGITRLAGPGWTGEERLGGEQLVVLEAEPWPAGVLAWPGGCWVSSWPLRNPSWIVPGPVPSWPARIQVLRPGRCGICGHRDVTAEIDTFSGVSAGSAHGGPGMWW